MTSCSTSNTASTYTSPTRSVVQYQTKHIMSRNTTTKGGISLLASHHQHKSRRGHSLSGS